MSIKIVRAAVAGAAALWLSACEAASGGLQAVHAQAERVPVVGARIRPEADAERFERLSDQLDAYVSDGRLPGGVAMVTQHGRVIYADAFGWRDIDEQEAMTEDTIFRIASQTKAVVTVAALILQEEGKLLIQDPVSRYLPEWGDVKVAVAKEGGGYDLAPLTRPITIRDLMTHTSGIGYGSNFGAPTPGSEQWREAGFLDWYFAEKDAPIRELVAEMAELPMPAQPGERWIYGYNIDILGAIVEEASGMPLDQFLKDRIFDPLGMTDTYFYLPPEKAERLATVYSAGPDGLTEAPPTGGSVSQGAYVEGPRKAFSGGAGLLSTAHDYSRFLQMLLNDGELDGARILSRKTIELMTADNLPPGVTFGPGQGMGLGVSVVEDVGVRGQVGSVGEFGWGGAYHSTYWVDPEEDLTVVYFTQTLPAGNVDDFAKLRTQIYQAIE
jgi:CubicO group peptidase (beta-lactamase class C family)